MTVCHKEQRVADWQLERGLEVVSGKVWECQQHGQSCKQTRWRDGEKETLSDTERERKRELGSRISLGSEAQVL